MHERVRSLTGKLRWLVPVVTCGLMGCPNHALAPLDPCTTSGASLRVPQSGVDKVDLLFVVDNSKSMAEEQLSLREQLSRMVLVLTSGDKEAGKDDPVDYPERRFTPVKSLHLGVVSTDLGAGRNPIPGCASPDDARLLHSVDLATTGFSYEVAGADETRRVAADPRCSGLSVPKYQEFVPPSDPNEIPEASLHVAINFGCVATLGVEGCGFEQQLEAMLKAVSPSDRGDFVNYQDFDDFAGISAFGQGDPSGYNAGFVRDDAVLAVVIVSDEEDCSITRDGADLFNLRPDSPYAGEPANLRCGLHRTEANLIHPVQRYVDGLRRLKPNHPDRIIFAAIVGVDPANENLPFEEMLARTQFSHSADPSDLDYEDAQPDPACIARSRDGEERGRAYPGERYIQVARAFGEDHAVIKSICNEDFRPALDLITDKIAAQLTDACLPRQLPIGEDGLVQCEVVEVLSAANSQESNCDPNKGRRYKERRRVEDDSERVVCEVQQVPVVNGAPQGTGWYYDNFSDGVRESCRAAQQQRITFTPGAELLGGSEARVECLQPVARVDTEARGREAVNSPCEGDGRCPSAEEKGESLVCVAQTCQLACPAHSNSQCPPGWVCADHEGTSFCVSPTCPPSFVR